MKLRYKPHYGWFFTEYLSIFFIVFQRTFQLIQASTLFIDKTMIGYRLVGLIGFAGWIAKLSPKFEELLCNSNTRVLDYLIFATNGLIPARNNPLPDSTFVPSI